MTTLREALKEYIERLERDQAANCQSEVTYHLRRLLREDEERRAVAEKVIEIGSRK